jgi:hypothetical protein
MAELPVGSVPLGGTEQVVAMVFSSEICVGFDFYKIKIFFFYFWFERQVFLLVEFLPTHLVC